MRYILLITFLSFSSLLSQEKISINFTIKYSSENYVMDVGIAEDATVDFDDKYENEKPPFQPPNGILPAFRLIRDVEGTDELIYSDVDMRPFPDEGADTISHRYRLDILGNIDTDRLDFAIPFRLDERIIKARLIDRVTEGNLVDMDLLEDKNFRIENQFIDEFYLEMSFDVSVSSIKEYKGRQLFYNKYSNALINETNKSLLYLLDSNGRKLDISGNDRIINLDYLTVGIYFVIFEDSKGNKKFLKFVKL